MNLPDGNDGNNWQFNGGTILGIHDGVYHHQGV